MSELKLINEIIETQKELAYAMMSTKKVDHRKARITSKQLEKLYLEYRKCSAKADKPLSQTSYEELIDRDSL